MTKPTIYCICYAKESGENMLPRSGSEVSSLIPIVRKNMDRSLFSHYGEVAEDDSGDNLSLLLGHSDLNPYFGDLTSLYWVWKNTSHEDVGVCHYRRFWDEEEILHSESNRLYVPEPNNVTYWGHKDVMSQYYYSHSDGIDAIKVLNRLSARNRIPISSEMLESMWTSELIYRFNMVRGSKLLFDKYSEILFSILFPLWEEIKHDVFRLDQYQKRSIAYIAERLVTLILLNAKYFFGKNRVKHSTIHFYED